MTNKHDTLKGPCSCGAWHEFSLHKGQGGHYDSIDVDGEVFIHLQPGTTLNEKNAEKLLEILNGIPYVARLQ